MATPTPELRLPTIHLVPFLYACRVAGRSVVVLSAEFMDRTRNFLFLADADIVLRPTATALDIVKDDGFAADFVRALPSGSEKPETLDLVAVRDALDTAATLAFGEEWQSRVLTDATLAHHRPDIIEAHAALERAIERNDEPTRRALVDYARSLENNLDAMRESRDNASALLDRALNDSAALRDEIESLRAAANKAASDTDLRPANCRSKLADAGQPYPRSGCAVCLDGGLRGCPYQAPWRRFQKERGGEWWAVSPVDGAAHRVREPATEETPSAGVVADDGASANGINPLLHVGDGVRAFPNDGQWANGMPEGGMSLRDWFAGQALAGHIATRPDQVIPTEAIARIAFAVADAMLAERAKGGEP